MKIAAMIVNLAITASLSAQMPSVSSGRIIRIENFNSEFVHARNVDIWVPENFNNNKKYAVLYMHDGQMLYDSTITWNKQDWEIDETMARLQQAKSIENCIVVGIWNTPLRHMEYFPQKALGYLTTSQLDSILKANRGEGSTHLFEEDIQSDNYLKFIVTELKPYVDANFQVYTDARHTFIAGSSMGGLISMYAICEYPQIFGAAACLSTHWPGTFTLDHNPLPYALLSYLQNHIPDPANHKLYFDYGTATLDAMYEPFQLKANQMLQAAGYNENNLKSLKFEGENHSEIAWSRRFYIPAEFLLGKN